ncbi:hypothetical protein H6P81_006706 [Aristolochia fimbriata]|uniref:Malectin-like domain-containing protein n=1 Tax=Aristolochia fimbriata TaxID=158543 RepID=A0AAV7EYA0_ARIFI|nr:hypothetical protein H6P81_006706 [Aristolochia fimbriata]
MEGIFSSNDDDIYGTGYLPGVNLRPPNLLSGYYYSSFPSSPEFSFSFPLIFNPNLIHFDFKWKTGDVLMIDCGGVGEGTWQSDGEFIQTGQSSKVQEFGGNWGREMDTLRFFPDQNKNCYTLPAVPQGKYIIQAGFFYGSYDGKHAPPSFDLLFDGNYWATVDTIRESPSFKEAIFFAKKKTVSVCVARIPAYSDQIPFVSTLVMVKLPLPFFYSRLGGDSALVMESRVNFGSPSDIWFTVDMYSRIWFPGVSPFYRNVTAPEPRNIRALDDDPPSSVMTSTIEAPNPSESMIFPFTLYEKKRLVYVNLYFTEAKASKKQRMFDVFINGKNMSLDLFLQYEMGIEVSLVLDAESSLFNLSLVPKEGSTLPPTISGLELFSIIEELANGTSDDDVKGLGKLTSNWERLKGWTGEPCLPSFSTWDWISCDSKDPPRVISLNLGSCGLEGQIIDFSQMQALEVIDFHNNSLNGSIPDFLGRLPNLKILNLADNQFSGIVPESIIQNKKISLDISGNSQLRYHPAKEKNNISMVLGISVGGASVFIVGCVLLFVLPNLIKREEENEEPAHAEPEDIPQEAPTGPSMRELDEDPVAEDRNDQFQEVSEEFRKQMEVDVEELLARSGRYSSEEDSDN